MEIITAYMVGILIGYAICGIALVCYLAYPHIKTLADWLFDSIKEALDACFK